MLLRILLSVFCVVTVLCHSAWADTGSISQPRKKNVLYLNSYHHGYQWSDEILKGIRSVFANSGETIELQIEYMDAKKYRYQDLVAPLLALYGSKFAEERFDLVVVSDNDALNFVTGYRNRLFPGVPVVFCGINGLDSADLSSGNITGVIENFDLEGTVAIARKLHPHVRRMIVVGDQSSAGQAIQRQVQQRMAQYDPTFTVDFWFELSLEETRQRVVDLPSDTILFFTPWYQAIHGRFYTTEEVMEALYESASVPMYTAWRFLLGHGAVGGNLLSGREHGRQAATMGLDILHGISADSIKIQDQIQGGLAFDYQVMQRLGINGAQLPAGSEIINQPKGFYALPKELVWTIVISLLLLLATLIGLMITMVERRRVERRVVDQLAFQETLMDSIPLLVSWKDGQGCYLGANRTFSDFFGLVDPEWVIGRTTEEVVADGAYVDWSMVADRDVVGNREAFRKVRQRIHRPNAPPAWLEVNKVPLRDQKGGIVGTLTAAENITKEVELEHQLLQSQKMEAIGTLAGGIAHDFNNILTSIINSTELALADLEAYSPTARDLERVVRAARRGSALVRQILSFSRPSQEGVEPTDLDGVLREVVGLLQASAPGRVAIDYRSAADPGPVQADPTQIHQVVLNLCTNALNALGEQQGRIEVRLDQQVVAEEAATSLNLEAGTYAVIQVVDDGPGIEPQVLDKIFDPFFTTRGNVGGTGLGLAVVHGIVMAHGGALRVHSEPGQGATFSVFLPARGGMLPNKAVLPTGQSLDGFHVLFVEDDPDQLATTPRILTGQGLEVMAAANPDEALSLANQQRFDLLITDYDLGPMNGVELAERLRPLPTILISGRADAIPMARTAACIGRVLLKPYGTGELVAAIQSVLQGERLHRDLSVR